MLQLCTSCTRIDIKSWIEYLIQNDKIIVLASQFNVMKYLILLAGFKAIYGLLFWGPPCRIELSRYIVCCMLLSSLLCECVCVLVCRMTMTKHSSITIRLLSLHLRTSFCHSLALARCTYFVVTMKMQVYSCSTFLWDFGGRHVLCLLWNVVVCCCVFTAASASSTVIFFD